MLNMRETGGRSISPLIGVYPQMGTTCADQIIADGQSLLPPDHFEINFAGTIIALVAGRSLAATTTHRERSADRLHAT